MEDWDDFDFEIVGFPFLGGGVPRSTSYGVYVSRLIPFLAAVASGCITGFSTRNKLRILSKCLLISSLPGKAFRTLVDIARLAERFNMRSQSRAW